MDFSKKTYTVKEAAKHFNVTDRVIYNEISAGKLKATKVGRKYSIPEEYLTEYCNQ